MKNLIPIDNLSYAGLLVIDTNKSYGSGFRLKYNDKNYLITAKHVLFDENEKLWGKILVLTFQNPEPGVDNTTILQVDLEGAKIHSSKTSDVAVILIGYNKKLYDDETPLKELKTKNKRSTTLYGETYISLLKGGQHGVSVDPEATRNLSDIRIANDVYLMGYPTSLGLQKNEYFDYAKPLLRKGIISGINHKERTFIIDCPSYQGNSGGPVVEDCEDDYFRVIGLVSRYIPYETKWFSNRDKIINTELTNSGYTVCVPMDEIFQLIESINKPIK